MLFRYRNSTDNGSPYIDKQLSLICGSIGTVLLHAPVRDGAAKAKVERNFRSMRERFLYGLDLDQIHSLDEFEALLKDYIRTYNIGYHSGIGCAPFERYQATKEHIRLPRSREWLEECFLNRVTRKVRKDATVPIDCKSYDVPMQFISQKVESDTSPKTWTLRSSFMKGSISPSGSRIRMKTAAQNGRTVSLSIIRRSEVETDVHGLLRPFLQSL